MRRFSGRLLVTLFQFTGPVDAGVVRMACAMAGYRRKLRKVCRNDEPGQAD
jgi:hypothetical protein